MASVLVTGWCRQASCWTESLWNFLLRPGVTRSRHHRIPVTTGLLSAAEGHHLLSELHTFFSGSRKRKERLLKPVAQASAGVSRRAGPASEEHKGDPSAAADRGGLPERSLLWKWLPCTGQEGWAEPQEEARLDRCHTGTGHHWAAGGSSGTGPILKARVSAFCSIPTPRHLLLPSTNSHLRTQTGISGRATHVNTALFLGLVLK